MSCLCSVHPLPRLSQLGLGLSVGVGTAAEFPPARFRFLVLFSSYLRVEVGELAGRE